MKKGGIKKGTHATRTVSKERKIERERERGGREAPVCIPVGYAGSG